MKSRSKKPIINRTTWLALVAALVLTPLVLRWSSNRTLDIMELSAQPNYAINFNNPTDAIAESDSYAEATLPTLDLEEYHGGTLEFWMKPTTAPASAANSVTVVRLADTANHFFEISFDHRRHLEACFSNNNVTITRYCVSTDTPLSLDAWHHVAVTDAADGMEAWITLFVNGELQETKITTVDPDLLAALPTLTIAKGGVIEGVSTSYDGFIEDFRISTNPRYSETGFTPPIFGSLVSDATTMVYWKFDQNGNDSSDNEILLNLVHEPAFVEVTDEPTHTACVEQACRPVVGMGEDSCSQDSECETAHHYRCNDDDQCVRVEGEGEDDCETNVDCEPVLTHHVCSDTHACVEVSGAGEDSCDADADCAAATDTSKSTNTSSNTTNPEPLSNRCNADKPNDVPDIYQIDTTNSRATLYFVPAKPPYTEYVIEYGENGTMQHSTSFGASRATGALSAAINSLKSRTEYTFRVRAMNECQPGEWSRTMKAITGSTTATQSYYKGFAGMVRSSVSRPSSITSTTKPAATKRPTAPSTTSVEPVKSPTSVTVPAPTTTTQAYTPPQPVPLWERILNFIFRR